MFGISVSHLMVKTYTCILYAVDSKVGPSHFTGCVWASEICCFLDSFEYNPQYMYVYTFSNFSAVLIHQLSL
jgi:hypothetical protein